MVVNASGALQDGSRDSLTGIHETAIAAMLEALRGRGTRFIQISAAGVSDTAPTEFFRSKARGEALLTRSDLDWIILRPTLVIGAQAYGGTALLRAFAAVPLLSPRVLPDSPVQTVAVADVARAVVQAARGEIATRTIADLTEAEPRSFAATVAAVRTWLGFPPWRASVAVPRPLLRALAAGADALGWLGWRPPLRTTAIRTLEAGILGDPAAWLAAGGQPCRPLEATLADLPATLQERWFARLYLLLPLSVATLSLFWLASGAIGLWQRDAAASVADRARPRRPARRRWSWSAAPSSTWRSASRSSAGPGRAPPASPWRARRSPTSPAPRIVAPQLWADPLGPLLKVLPSIVLGLQTAAILDER